MKLPNSTHCQICSQPWREHRSISTLCALYTATKDENRRLISELAFLKREAKEIRVLWYDEFAKREELSRELDALRLKHSKDVNGN